MAIFEADDFENRQYAYERNVLYAFSIPAYIGTGIRQYALLQYKMNQRFTFWLRYSRFIYNDRDSVGSGLEQSDGNTRSQMTFQTRIKL